MNNVFMAIVDEDKKEIYVEREGIVTRYHLHMYEAALWNDKYWDDAFIEVVDKRIPELIFELNPPF